MSQARGSHVPDPLAQPAHTSLTQPVLLARRAPVHPLPASAARPPGAVRWGTHRTDRAESRLGPSREGGERQQQAIMLRH